MKNKALGNIETYGLVPAIEAADAALKAANVELINCEYVKGGLVTIFIVGDVSAVKSAVDAGVAAADRVGKVVSKNVIARMADSLDKIVFKDEEEKNSPQNTLKEEKDEDEIENKDEIESKDEIEDVFVKLKNKKINISKAEELEKIKVTELRRLVREIPEIKLDNEEIKYGRKQELIDVLLEYSKEVKVDDKL